MHNALELQTLNSVSTHEDAKGGAGTYTFVDSECVRTLASAAACLYIARSVMVVIHCRRHFARPDPGARAMSLYYVFCPPLSPCLSPFIPLFICPFKLRDYLISNCHQVCCISPGPHPSSSKIRGFLQKNSISITAL